MMKYILSLDVGTTNVRSYIYNSVGCPVFSESQNVEIISPELGSSEIEPDHLWSVVRAVVQSAVDWGSKNSIQLAGIGISLQRNTGTFWDRKSGKMLHNFVTWQDVRCKEIVKEVNNSISLRALRSGSSFLHFVTGMKKFLAASVIHYKAAMVCPRFIWLMRKLNCEKLCRNGEVVWGCIDSWLIRKMNGATFDGVHKSEITNSAASGLYDPFELEWSSIVCATVGVPTRCLPKVVSTTSHEFGIFEEFGLPICAISGDVNAAMIGEKMTEVGDIKVTMGTGAFVDLNTGNYPFPSTTGCYPLVGWQIGENAPVTYLAEADDNSCGAAVDWGARAGFYESAAHSEEKARMVDHTNGVYFIPALWGISSPINDPTATCALLGLGPKTKQPHCVRAILHALAFRSFQLIETLKSETKIELKRLSIDGGVSRNKLICEKIATLAQSSVIRAVDIEASARGASFFAGIGAGIYTMDNLPDIEHQPLVQPSKDFDHAMSEYTCWKDSIKRTLKWQQIEIEEEDGDLLNCITSENSIL